MVTRLPPQKEVIFAIGLNAGVRNRSSFEQAVTTIVMLTCVTALLLAVELLTDPAEGDGILGYLSAATLAGGLHRPLLLSTHA